jgi:site-specific DNA recombinase
MVIGYVRVSTDKQADRGFSLEAQTDRLRAMAVVQGVELSEVIVDAGESAKSLNRPGMLRLLALVDSGQVESVIIVKLDRLTRSVADLAELLKRFEKRGVALVSISDSLDTKTAAGRLVLNLLVSVSQWEREAIGERTRDVLRHKKAAGLRIGTVPYGFRSSADGRLSPDHDEQRTLAFIRERHALGLSLRAIATELNARGTRTRRGSSWKHQYVANALSSPAPPVTSSAA